MSILNHFPEIQLSNDQQIALEKLEAFLSGNSHVFMLKGYAGSGKTTILKGLVDYLNSIERPVCLMAPTGRAAKVICEKTGEEATTIHKAIYNYEELVEIEPKNENEEKTFYYAYKIRNNDDVANKIFIVDESSMLSDAFSQGEFFRFGTGHLLTDLIYYSRVKEQTSNTKIIFVGDPAQLPPVGDNSSKAFDENYLAEKFSLVSEQVEMKEVKRYSESSGVMKVAARLRKSLTSGFFNDFNLSQNGTDIINPSYEEFLDVYSRINERKIIVAYKNETCKELNAEIRELKYGSKGLPIQKGDIVIIGANNYRKGIMNGEFAVVNEVDQVSLDREIHLRGKKSVLLKWRNVELVFPDGETNGKVVRGKMLDNFLFGENFLKPDEMQALYVDFKNRHPNLKPKTDAFKDAILNDPFYNSIMVKYGYAVTCHKAQGGEWPHVFTFWDHDSREGYDCFRESQRKAGKTNQDFYRWAYTAVTRASEKLYAVNPPYFNSYSTMAFTDDAVLNSLTELTGINQHPQEIELDDAILTQLQRFGLLEKDILLQDHFIKVLTVLSHKYVEVTGWEKVGYEVRYSFKREAKTSALKTWIDGNNKFNGKFMEISIGTNSKEFLKEVGDLITALPNLSIKRNTSETIITKLEFDAAVEEKLPFTRTLFEDITANVSEYGISIEDINHQQYKERYTFSRGSEKAEIDFQYNQQGFFGRVVPLVKKCNSPVLISDIKTAIQRIKSEEYAG